MTPSQNAQDEMRPSRVFVPSTVDKALAVVKEAGYVAIKEKSYRQAQERQRVAEALRRSEAEAAGHARSWAHEAFEEQRRLADRCTYLYGLAARHGATDEELSGQR